MIRASPVDLRIISATNRDLDAATRNNEFRSDLYYRVNVVTLEVPVLRQCDTQNQSGVSAREIRFSTEAMERLLTADWPGNVRQFRNVVEQCAALTPDPMIPAGLVERALRTRARALQPLKQARDRFEFDYLSQLLESTAGNVAMAARLAEGNRTEFYTLLRKHGLKPGLFRRNPEAAGTTMTQT